MSKERVKWGWVSQYSLKFKTFFHLTELNNWCQVAKYYSGAKSFPWKETAASSKASSSCSKQTIQIFVHFSVTQIHHIIFFQALLLLFFATSFFPWILFLLPRIQLPLNMVLLYCFLSFFSWEEMLTQKWQRMKSKMMLLIHLLLFLPCRSRHLSFWKKLYVIGPLGLSSIEMKNCNEKLLPIYVLTWKNKDRLAVYVVVHFLLHKKWTLHCF